MSTWKKLLWIAVSLLGLFALAVLALSRGEQVSALWIVTAGLCTFAVSYRFYSKWLATKVLVLNNERATPAIAKEDGKDFVKSHLVCRQNTLACRDCNFFVGNNFRKYCMRSCHFVWNIPLAFVQ